MSPVYTWNLDVYPTVVYFHQMMYLSFTPLDVGEDEGKNVCVSYMGMFSFCTAWQDGGCIFYK